MYIKGMIKIIPFFIFMTLNAFAENCLEISESQLNNWLGLRPKAPALAELIKAKKLVDAEKDFALTLGSDKTAHCYLGCRISHAISFEAARYSAWQKEHIDATDCNFQTYFDLADYDATMVGANIQNDSCVMTCQKVLP